MAFSSKNKTVRSQTIPDAIDLAAEAEMHPFESGTVELATRQASKLAVASVQPEDPKVQKVAALSRDWLRKNGQETQAQLAVERATGVSLAPAERSVAPAAQPAGQPASAPASSWGQPKVGGLTPVRPRRSGVAVAPAQTFPQESGPQAQDNGFAPLATPTPSALSFQAPQAGDAFVEEPRNQQPNGFPVEAVAGTLMEATPTPSEEAPANAQPMQFMPSPPGVYSAQERQALEELKIDHTAFTELERGAIEALMAISQTSSVFPLRSWERVLKKKRPDLEHWMDAANWKQARRLALSKIGVVPVLDGDPDKDWAQHSTLRMLALEEEMLGFAKRQSDAFPIPEELVEAAFASRPTMAEEQREAARACVSGTNAVVIVEGTAGAGKSFTLNAVREIYENAPPAEPGGEPGYNILGTAISWSATKVLEASAKLSGGRALAHFLGQMDKAKEKGEEFFPRRTIMIVDEAGLVGTEEMARLLRHCAQSAHPVRVILTGDSLQLAPVSGGNALEALVDVCGSARLDTIRRQVQESHRQAVKHFCFGRSQNGLFSYWQQEAIQFCKNAEERFSRVIGDFVSWQVENPTKTGLVLALSNDDVQRLNLSIRDAMKKAGRVSGPEYMLRVTNGRSSFEAAFAVGDQVVFRQNVPDQPIYKSQFKKTHEAFTPEQLEKAKKARGGLFASLLTSLGMAKPDEVQDQGLFNRSCGVVLSIKPQSRRPGTHDIRVLLSEGGEVVINTGDYFDADQKAVPMTHNFATTIYASQGQTVNRVMMLDSPMMSRRLAYVGMSRHTELCDIYVDEEELVSRLEKNREKAIEGAWKAFARERARMSKRLAELAESKLNPWKKNPGPVVSQAESARKLRAELRDLEVQETPGETLAAPRSLLLSGMINTWNKDSPNQTVHILRKRQAERKVEQSAPHMMLPHRALEDNPDDNPQTPWPKPSGFGAHASKSVSREEAQVQRAKSVQQRFMGMFSKPQEDAPVVDPVHSIKDFPGVSEEAYTLAEGPVWTRNRFGEERVLAREPSGEIVARYDLQGHCVAGDGEPAVFPNADQLAAGLPAPFLIVPDARAAAISYAHYREKYQDHPEKIPHLIAALPDTDWSKLTQWVGPMSRANFFVGWSPADPSSFQKAESIAQKLIALGAQTRYYPRAPTRDSEMEAPPSVQPPAATSRGLRP